MTWLKWITGAVVAALLLLLGRKAQAADRSPMWPKTRAAHLKIQPVCQVCGSKEKPEVHHKYPVGFPGGKLHELRPDNLITLCDPHHLLFGHLYDYKAMNPFVEQDCALWRHKISARLYPPKEQ